MLKIVIWINRVRIKLGVGNIRYNKRVKESRVGYNYSWERDFLLSYTI